MLEPGSVVAGPFCGRPGFGVIAEAMSGLRHITGDPDRRLRASAQ